MSLETKFASEFWRKLKEYLEKHAVLGRKLDAAEPNSMKLHGNKIPDIVIVDDKGIPVLIIETKREAEGEREERLLDPFTPAPIAQAVCYASLAFLDYGASNRTPMFATANPNTLILFKGIEKEDLNKIVDVNECLKSKRSPEDWAKALKLPDGLQTLLEKYIIDRIENPSKDESVKKLFEYVGNWVSNITITPSAFYKLFIDQLRGYIEDIHTNYVSEAVKNKILTDKDYFKRLFDEAKEAGYPNGLFSKGILRLKCPSGSEKLCEYLKEKIEGEIAKAKTLDEEYDALKNISNMSILKLCSEAKLKGIPLLPICNEPKYVRDFISFDNLTKMMTYVLVNKILAHKILELYYKDVYPLKSFKIGDVIDIDGQKIKIDSPDNMLNALNKIFEHTSKVLEQKHNIKDFKPIFRTGLYDEIVLSGLDSINAINRVIDFIEAWKEGLTLLPGIVGYVYEGLIPPKERHQLGQFYTPPAIARLIVKWSIRSGNDKVLDPGCGSGTFLIEAYKRLLQLKYYKSYDNKQYPSCNEKVNEHQEILNQLYGIDINAFAANLTAVHLMLMEPRCPISKLNIEARDFFSVKPSEKVFGEKIESFDVILGNPPYTRWVEIPDETQNLILKNLSSEFLKYDLKADVKRGREPGIYIYWIMHAAKFLKDKGRLGMIISNTWLQTDYGVDFGKYLLDNFRIVGLIDISYRLFDALISTVIILAEKESNKEARDNNIVTLIRIPPILGEEKVEKILDEALRCIEDSIESDGSLVVNALTKCKDKYGIWFKQIKQGDIPKDKKWISLFFDVEEIEKKLETHPLMIKLGEWFEPSRGNSLYSCLASLGIVRSFRDIGAKDFFYFSRKKIDEFGRSIKDFRNTIKPYLVPAITSAQYIKTFTFTKNDWEAIERNNKNAYIFVCHEPRDKLPEGIQSYIKWGETECRTKIRGTRGGGKPCSEAETCKTRANNPKIFYGWYDLGGYIPTPLMAIYQPRYHPQFFYVELPVVTYHAIITFIPKIKVKTKSLTIDPSDFIQKYPSLSRIDIHTNIELDEMELKALLAYLNSTFAWLWLEQNARYIAKGPLGLEINILRDMPLLNVKKLKREDIEELANLFDKLEKKSREMIAGMRTEEENEEEDSSVDEDKTTKLKMFEKLKPYFQDIDKKIADILRIDVDVDQLWGSVWEMMERRVKGAKGPTRPGSDEFTDIDVSKRNIKQTTLDEWLK